MAWTSSNESKVPSLSTGPRRRALGLRPANRMEHLQRMKSDGHGQYREVVDEKEVIRLSA